MGKRKKPALDQVSSIEIGEGGEVHFTSVYDESALTTNQGLPLSDNQNSLRAAPIGPVLLEDFILREKITHFDHERIPERVVHARGYGAHGYFQCYKSFEDITCADFLCDPNAKTPVFVRFSTVAGSAGSSDTARDARGFAVKFYTAKGNFDLVGNNIPVFFIQDAMKFPDLVHSVKPEPDRGFPQAQSAHDTFWDYISCTPESMHMVMWIMSDWALPRSFRMMPGFGVHTFQMVTDEGQSQMVKFHWRPKLGSFALLWEEAVTISGADPDFHRRDLWDAIEAGDFPEWEFSVQVISAERVASLGIDVLDPTKLIPEELVPLTPLGIMVLNRNVDNFFAETEQVAFCPANLVRGIDFSNDPLLQGRLFSYLDTQLSRLGNSNFHQLPINAPKCPMRNFTRDGHMQMRVPKGRVSYEPSLLESASLYENQHGFRSHLQQIGGDKARVRSSTFADHFSQAQSFFQSQTAIEQEHIEDAFVFELGKCKDPDVRSRIVDLLTSVDEPLALNVGRRLGLPAVATNRDTKRVEGLDAKAASLSLLANTPESIAGKKVGVLLSNNFDDAWLEAVSYKVNLEKGVLAIVAPTPAPVLSLDNGEVQPDDFLDGAPSCFFDCIIVAANYDELSKLGKLEKAADWVRTAFRNFKVIGYSDVGESLLTHVGVSTSAAGVIAVGTDSVDEFVRIAKGHRVWDRKFS